MKPFRVCLILFLGLLLLAQGCSRKTSEKTVATKDPHEQIISQLRSDLANAAEELGRHKEENNVLANEVTRLKAQITELELKAAQQPEPAPPAQSPEQASPADDDMNPETRVELLGAKAVAEFRAQQLSQRVDKLTRDLENKEQELGTIRTNAEKKQAEVARLSETLDRLQAEDQSRSKEVNQKLENMSKELAARSEESKRFKTELEEKAALLNTLKQAVDNAARLKTHCETEVAKMHTVLEEKKAALEKVRAQLEDAVKEIQQYQIGEEDLRREVAQFQETVDRSRRQAAQSAEETEQLRAEIAKLNERLNAAEVKTEQEPSAIDQILQTPAPVPQKNDKSALY